MSRPSRAAGPEAAKRILLVDDERTVVFSLGRFLRLHGFEVDAAQRQAEAERLLDTHRYDVVLTDLRLTGTGGTEGLTIIEHARRVHPNALIVLLTAYGTEEVLDAARDLGVDTILSKPVLLDHLLEVVSPQG